MDAVFMFVFGLAIGMAAMPHLQRMVEQARQRLARLDRTNGPDSRA